MRNLKLSIEKTWLDDAAYSRGTPAPSATLRIATQGRASATDAEAHAEPDQEDAGNASQ
jgi:hypothetical protein